MGSGYLSREAGAVGAATGAAVVILAREEELRPLAGVLRLERIRVAPELRRQLDVAGLLDQREQLDEVVRALRQVMPKGDLRAQPICLAADALSRPPVVPEAGLLRQRIEFGEASLPCREVKDAPRWPGSALRDPGWRRDPSTP